MGGGESEGGGVCGGGGERGWVGMGGRARAVRVCYTSGICNHKSKATKAKMIGVRANTTTEASKRGS